MKCKECDALKDEILQLQKLLLLTQEEMINEMTDRVDSEKNEMKRLSISVQGEGFVKRLRDRCFG